MIINFILLHIFFIIKINSKKYITSDLTIKFEKGDSDTYYISNDLIKSTALIYCSLDGAMEINNGKKEPFKTQLYVIFPENNYPNEYEINLNNFTEIYIDGFGDCFYCNLSQFFENNQRNHLYIIVL